MLRDKGCFVRCEPVHMLISWSFACLTCGMPGLRAWFEGVCLRGWAVTSEVFELGAALRIVQAACCAVTACRAYSKTPLAGTRYVWVWLLCLQAVRRGIFGVDANFCESFKYCVVDAWGGMPSCVRAEETSFVCMLLWEVL